MPVVAMTREMGSLGSPIAQEIARRLGYEFLRNDILRSAARESQLARRVKDDAWVERCYRAGLR